MLDRLPQTVPVDGRQSEIAFSVARGVRRLLRSHGFSTISELSLASGRRADLVAICGKGSIHIIEIKSCIADLRTDQKWPDYREHCDRLYFAIPPDMPADIMPEDTGLFVADSYGAELLREAPEHKLSPATRRSMLLRFATAAADRLHALSDPDHRILP